MSTYNLVSKRTMRKAALCTGLASIAALPLMAFAQTEQGGVLMHLDIAERFLSRTTSSPDPDLDGDSQQAITDLHFTLRSETRTQTAEIELGGGYRFSDSPAADGIQSAFNDPSLRLSYSQIAPASAIHANLRANRTDLDGVNVLDSVLSADGILDPDFPDLTQIGGMRDRLNFNSTLRLRDDAPFGINFGLNLINITYTDLPDASSLTDYTHARFRAGVRLDMTDVMQPNVGLHFAQTGSASSDTADRYGIDAGLILARPTGDITIDLEAATGDSGTQRHLLFGRHLMLENTNLRLALGASQASTDDIFTTGTMRLEHSFADNSPWGTITAHAMRRLSRDGNHNEDIETTVSLATNYALSPIAQLTLTSGFAQSEDIVTGVSVDLAQSNVSLAYDFTPDWTATAGIGRQSRGSTESTTLSLGLSRSFDLRR